MTCKLLEKTAKIGAEPYKNLYFLLKFGIKERVIK